MRDVKFVVVVVAGVAVVGVIVICTVTILALRTLERQRRKAKHFAMGGCVPMEFIQSVSPI